MRTIVVPDLHNRIHWIELFLSKEVFDEVVFLGDYFDQHDTTVIDTRATATWLKFSLAQPKRIHLFGNHDLGYAYQHTDKYSRLQLRWMHCEGNTPKKYKAINKIITRQEWDQLRLLYITQGWHLSHAGLSEHHFAKPFIGFADAEKICERALENVRNGMCDPVLTTGWARRHVIGNKTPTREDNEPGGGILWQDWHHEFEPIEGINQIVGHTVNIEAGVRSNHFHQRSEAVWLNYCIDVNSAYVAIIEDGEVTFKYVGGNILPEKPKRIRKKK